MIKQPPVLIDILHFCEFIAILFGILNMNKIKNSYWRWFVVYLLYVFLYEMLGKIILNYSKNGLDIIFSYITIPIEFLFFIWLFALKSLKNKTLFVICSFIYLLSFIPELSIDKGKNFFNSFNYIIGTFILLYLVFLELQKQMKSDDILYFKENKMFYITIGIILFYIGNLPFFGLYFLILKEPQIWNYYYIYFMISNCLMYLLFAASFIWGKPK